MPKRSRSIESMNFAGWICLIASSILATESCIAGETPDFIRSTDDHLEKQVNQAPQVSVPPLMYTVVDEIKKELPAGSLNDFLKIHAESAGGSRATSGLDLRYFSVSIQRGYKNVSSQRQPTQNAGRSAMLCHDRNISLTRYFPVTRPGEKNIVGIIHIVNNSAILNPVSGFDYGPIPLLQDMKLAQADQLWAQKETEKASPSLRVYRLNATDRSNQVTEFLLECSFDETGALNGYKIKGDGADPQLSGPMYSF